MLSLWCLGKQSKIVISFWRIIINLHSDLNAETSTTKLVKDCSPDKQLVLKECVLQGQTNPLCVLTGTSHGSCWRWSWRETCGATRSHGPSWCSWCRAVCTRWPLAVPTPSAPCQHAHDTSASSSTTELWVSTAWVSRHVIEMEFASKEHCCH